MCLANSARLGIVAFADAALLGLESYLRKLGLLHVRSLDIAVFVVALVHEIDDGRGFVAEPALCLPRQDRPVRGVVFLEQGRRKVAVEQRSVGDALDRLGAGTAHGAPRHHSRDRCWPLM